MKKYLLLIYFFLFFFLLCIAKDKTIMRINGEIVNQSEFEYLYKKNINQQCNSQTFEDYIELFQLYKMKVMEAKAQGYDTLASFKKEIEKYRHDLALPYIVDSVFLNKLLQEAYNRSLEEVDAKHIMFFKSHSEKENQIIKAKLDSIRAVIISGNSFEDCALRYSEDRGSSMNGGSLGFIKSGLYPYSFELAVYQTPLGHISQVVESPVGYHIIKGSHHRKSRGEVKVAHILKLSSKSENKENKFAKEKIDSIYNLVKYDGSSFADVARIESQDPGSAKNGGVLPWFSSGDMVAEFDSVAFSLKKGEISKPFRSQFGWHIIQLLDQRDPLSISKMRQPFFSKISNPQDERFDLVLNNQLAKLKKIHKSKENKNVINKLYTKIEKIGFDSLRKEIYNGSNLREDKIFRIDNEYISVSEFISTLSNISMIDLNGFKRLMRNYYLQKLTEAEELRLERTEPSYGNLMREYIDGSLLYEISLKEIWNKASEDKDGLRVFFERNKEKYKWNMPRIKGILVYAKNDTICNEIIQNISCMSEDSIIDHLRIKYGSYIIVEKIVVECGINPDIDNLVFVENKKGSSKADYPICFIINPRTINCPENLEDVQSMVISDYQNYLQNNWEYKLKKKYKVEYNNKLLKKIKGKFI